MRTSRQSLWVETEQLRCARPSGVTNLENLIKFILGSNPQVLDGYGTSSVFSFAHVCKAAAPLNLTDMGELWLNDI